MKIFIAYEIGMNPIGILLAEDKDKAGLAFTAMKEDVMEIEELDINDLKRDCEYGVVFLLTSNKRKINRPDETHVYRKWRRGLK